MRTKDGVQDMDPIDRGRGPLSFLLITKGIDRHSLDCMQYFGYKSSEEAMEAAKQLEELRLDSGSGNPAAPGGADGKVRQASIR